VHLLKKFSIVILVCLIAIGVVMASGCTDVQNTANQVQQTANDVNNTVSEINNTTTAVQNTANNLQQITGQ
jgi:cell division protein FtsL